MVRTRFAPSPTGYLHIGGVRTALFNWLFARQHGGQFILRIDDTDQAAECEEALQPILDGFRWLGIDWDEGPEVGGPYGPYYQSQRQARYQAAVEQLLRTGYAYRDYAPPEEIQAEREAAEAEKRPFLYSRRWMAETAADAARFEAAGRTAVVRLKMPRCGDLPVSRSRSRRRRVRMGQEQDHVIQRADGTCLYHLASVVDDQDFAITHVIRAEEHLSNTPRQVFIAQSLGYPLPEYAHLPFVAEPGSKNKLSKRKLDKYLKNRDFAKLYEHGAAHRASDRPRDERRHLQSGDRRFLPDRRLPARSDHQLPAAARLVAGRQDRAFYARGDDPELLARAREQVAGQFRSDEAVGVPAARHDGAADGRESRAPDALRATGRLGAVRSTPQQAATRVRQIAVAAGDRIKTAGDILDYPEFFCADDQLAMDAKDFDKRVRTGRRRRPAAAACANHWRGWSRSMRPRRKRRCDRSWRRRASRSVTSSTRCAWRSPASPSDWACSMPWRSWGASAW